MFVCDGCGAPDLGVGDVDVHSCRENKRPMRVLLVEGELHGAKRNLMVRLFRGDDARQSVDVYGHSLDANATLGAIVRHFAGTGSLEPDNLYPPLPLRSGPPD